MTEENKVVPGTDMIDQEVFDREWKHFKDAFGGSDQDIIHGLMVITAIKTIVESALKLPTVEASLEDEA